MSSVWNTSFATQQKIREKQTELYNKCMFIKGLSEAMDKIKEE